MDYWIPDQHDKDSMGEALPLDVREAMAKASHNIMIFIGKSIEPHQDALSIINEAQASLAVLKIDPVKASRVCVHTLDGDRKPLISFMIQRVHSSEVPLEKKKAIIRMWLETFVEAGLDVNGFKKDAVPAQTGDVLGEQESTVSQRGVSLKKILSMSDSTDHPPLFEAALYDDLETVKWLLDHGAHGDFVTSRGDTFLHAASRASGSEVATWILSQQEIPWSIDAANELEKTALHEAITGENLVVMEMLLAAGADANLKNIHDDSALLMAVSYDFIKGAQLLIAYGARLDEQGPWGDTAIHYAVVNGNLPMFFVLVEAGASLDVRSRQWGSIEEAAISCYHDEILGHIKSIRHVQQERKGLEALLAQQESSITSSPSEAEHQGLTGAVAPKGLRPISDPTDSSFTNSSPPSRFKKAL